MLLARAWGLQDMQFSAILPFPNVPYGVNPTHASSVVRKVFFSGIGGVSTV